MSSSVSKPAIEVATPEEVLTRLYDESQILGIAVADHSNFQPFHRLLQLLEARGLDPKLKTVVIEDSHLRADLYASMSQKEMSREEWTKAAKELYANEHPQDDFMFDHVFPLLRKINEQRPGDPVIAVPVDGLTNRTAMESVFAPLTPARPHSSRVDRAIDVGSFKNDYGGSIQRERETARHFLTNVARKYPGRKSIVIYQGAHIFKNLRAIGADTDANGKVIKRGYLGWINIARSQAPELMGSYNVIAVDNRSTQWAPEGMFKLPSGISREAGPVGLFWKGTTTPENTIFMPDSFMATYRNSTITSIRPNAPIFDAAIIEAP